MKKIIILLIVVACTSPKGETPAIKISGTLKRIMMENKTEATIALDSLKDEKHLYGLGAVEGIQGEILIWDSNPIITQVEEDSVYSKHEYSGAAALLVYTNVSEWNEFPIDQKMSMKELEEELGRISLAEGLSQPFPFLIKTSEGLVQGHVVAGSHDAHDSGYKMQSQDQSIEILGFYSDHHQGVFTHHSSSVHMHFKDVPPTFNAHVDELELKGKSVILLPKQL